MRMRIVFLAAFAVAANASLMAEDAATATLGGIRLNTVTLPAPFDTMAAVDELANWPVTYRAGETVMVTAPDGTTSYLAENAAASGAATFVPTAGGLWRLTNSGGATASIGVAWSVFGDGSSQDFGTASPFRMDTNGEGPNRAVKKRNVPLVSYSGDDWLGDVAAAASVTFVSPLGVSTTLDFTGTGAHSFEFSPTGVWTVSLTMADGTTREATIIVAGGFAISFR